MCLMVYMHALHVLFTLCTDEETSSASQVLSPAKGEQSQAASQAEGTDRAKAGCWGVMGSMFQLPGNRIGGQVG